MPEIHLEDTIAAIATPAGEGGISVLRLSGPDSFRVLAKIFKPVKGKLEDFSSHTVHLGEIAAGGQRIDQVLVSLFLAPNSYTGQDVLEISAHGGLVVTKNILDLLIKNGARHAEPGEFTKRAFLNGKIDLTQAEAVLDLIRAKSEKSLTAAVRQLGGSLSQRFKEIKDELMKMYAHMEAFLDFPEEDLEIYEDKVFAAKFSKITEEIQALIAGFARGSLLREGALVAIAGKPNVGKSSVFNALLSRDRALVSEHPGTTRDTLEEAIEVGGIYLRLVDTAGLSPEIGKKNPVDLMGMERTRQILKDADSFLYILDGSAAIEDADRLVYEEITRINSASGSKPVLVLINKSDLPQKIDKKVLQQMTGHKNVIEISAKDKKGFENLEESLRKTFSSFEVAGEQITRLRHKNALEEAAASLRQSQAAFLKRDSLEFVVEDLKRSIDVLRELIGEIYSEDLLDVIFSEFCIGK